MAKMERIFDLLYSIGQHLDPAAAAVPVPHIAARPPEQTVNHLPGGPGTSEGIGRVVSQGMEALPVALGTNPVKPSVRPTLEVPAVRSPAVGL
jgi:hypothetical protein